MLTPHLMVKPFTFLHVLHGHLVMFSVFLEPIFVSRVVDKICGACSMNGEKEMHIGYWRESQKEIDH
jgi:hypothetical protein